MAKTFLESIKYKLVQPHYPDVGIEFNSDSIRLAVVEAVKGKLSIQHLDSEPIPEGSMDINPVRPNILLLEPVAQALRNLWSRNRFKESKCCLLLQDRAAVVYNITLEHAAANPRECAEVIRFKLKKSIPFRVEEAVVSYFNPNGVVEHTGTNLWASIIHNTVLHQYEQFVQSTIDVECGLVDLATFNAMNLAHAHIKATGQQGADLLYVNLNPEYISIAITQKGHLAFYRTRAMERHNGMLEEAISEIHPTTMYYLDKLHGEKLAGAFVHSPEAADDLSKHLQSELQIPTLELSIETFSGTRFDNTNQKMMRSFAPLAGMLLSRRMEFV